MGKLKDLLAGADTFSAALGKTAGHALFVDKLPSPPRIEVIETKSDYFIGLWKGNTAQKEFFAKYDLEKLFSLAE